MANWSNYIKLEVQLPYVTQGCTLGYLKAELKITNEDIWLSGMYWKAYIKWGDYPILVMGKITTKYNLTNYKVSAWCTTDGMTNGKEQYKCRVVSCY